MNTSHRNAQDATHCPVCKAHGNPVKYALTTHNILCCRSCGLLYNGAFPPKDSREEAFDEHYYFDVQRSAFQRYADDYLSDPSVMVFRRWLSRIEALGKKDSLLDVGCGLGTFMAVARDAGWRVRGLDVSPFAAKTVQEQFGFEVFSGTLPECPWENESFDLITFWDSIEHVDQPKTYMEKAHQLLKTGGIALVATDNFDCLICDIAKFLYASTGGRSRYAMQKIYIPFNATYFTDGQFLGLAESCGYELVEVIKMEYPLEKINHNLLEKMILRILYGTAKLLGRQAQFTVVFRKR